MKIALLLIFLSFNAFASLDCNTRDDLLWGDKVTYNHQNIVFASEKEIRLIFRAFERYTWRINNLDEALNIADDEEIFIYDVYAPGDMTLYKAVSFYAGDNTFEYVMDDQFNVVAQIIDWACE